MVQFKGVLDPLSRPGSSIGSREDVVAEFTVRIRIDYPLVFHRVDDVVISCFDHDGPIFVVPVLIFFRQCAVFNVVLLNCFR